MSSSPSNSSIVAEWKQLNHQYAEVAEGIKVHFVDVGPRDATPVVLVHGWPDFSFGWRHQIGPLSKKYRVIVPDMRGFGSSSVPREVEAYGAKNITSDFAKLLGKSANTYARHLDAAPQLIRYFSFASLDFLNIPRAVFVGHDWGGNIIYRMALYHPDRVLAIVGICTPYYPPSEQYVDLDTMAAAIPGFAYMKFLADTEAASKHLEAAPSALFTAVYRSPQPPAPEGAPKVTFLDILRGIGHSDHPVYTHRSDLLSEEELNFYVSEYTASGFKGACNFYATRAIDFENERGLPSIIPHQALYVGAGRDPVLKPELAAHMPQVVPKLEFALVKEGGHWLLWGQKDEVTKVLIDWLDKLDTSASP